MRVLAGVNGTPRSLEAVRFAASVVDAASSDFVFYFSPPDVKVEGEERMIPSIPSHLREALVEDVMENARKMLPADLQGRVEAIVGEKKAAAGLLLAAQQVGADLIVLGADDQRHGFPSYLGGVARTVSRQADAPVLVFRQPPHDRKKGLRVILAHDGSHAASVAATALSSFVFPTDSEGIVIRVVEWTDAHIEGYPDPPNAWRRDFDKLARKAANAALEELATVAADLPAIFRDGMPRVESGAVVKTLARAAVELEADLMVLGSRNLGPLHRLLGSTTESLLHYAPCSVLVVHPREAP